MTTPSPAGAIPAALIYTAHTPQRSPWPDDATLIAILRGNPSLNTVRQALTVQHATTPRQLTTSRQLIWLNAQPSGALARPYIALNGQVWQDIGDQFTLIERASELTLRLVTTGTLRRDQRGHPWLSTTTQRHQLSGVQFFPRTRVLRLELGLRLTVAHQLGAAIDALIAWQQRTAYNAAAALSLPFPPRLSDLNTELHLNTPSR